MLSSNMVEYQALLINIEISPAIRVLQLHLEGGSSERILYLARG